ncbi:recombinase family protein [Phenylobacterium sp.]|uniref:recombinase family protein n=1 Tax=Phenylobacterium sp. TaxID=1871053 RepID=UPI00351E8411
MTRCAVYARYSSDRQNARSIADQVAQCTEYAASRGWIVVQSLIDAAISGAAIQNRPGVLDALHAAERGEFDVLLAEDEDRFARNIEHQAHIFNRLVDVGVRLHTMASGDVSELHVALKGLMAQQYITNLSAKTKRGMHSNAEKGLATGARTYGYRSQPGGAVEVVDEEALIVRRIFTAYAAGDSPREIALSLNQDGIEGPRGGLWNGSTISGARARGNGILNTELYVGIKVWGRDEVRKDRQSGKRQHRYLPPDQWKRTSVPHLRIVDDETWNKVRKRKDAASHSPHSVQRRPSLFGGRLRCGCCGGSYTTYTTGKLVCLNHREGRGCFNRRTPSRAKVEKRVLEGLREQMLSPEATAAFVREYARAAQERARNAALDAAPLQRRLGEVERAITRAVDAIVGGLDSPAVRRKLEELEREKQELTTKLAEADREPQPFVLHPAAADQFATMVATLEASLPDAARGDTDAERRLKEAVLGLVERVVITPLSQERGGEIEITIQGTLQSLLAEHPANLGLGGVVAGGGLEPPTCGL